jgi:hypothetical protein
VVSDEGCASGFIDCGDNTCCPEGTVCNARGSCDLPAACPSDYEDCGDGSCCPPGTTCGAGTCEQAQSTVCGNGVCEVGETIDCADCESMECEFSCGDGSCIFAETVCNGADDCPNGADETFELCGDPNNCCVATLGCPGETGSDCGATCCCCGPGEACCADYTQGCCATP